MSDYDMTPTHSRVPADLLAHLLVKHGVIQSAAIDDAEGYDNFATAAAVVNVAIELSSRVSNYRNPESKLLAAASALIADVRRRYPGEKLRCPLMQGLDAAIKSVDAIDTPAAHVE